MRSLMLAGAILILVGRGWGGDVIPQTPGEALKQVEQNAKELQDTERYWIEKHQKDDEIQTQQDINDTLILNGDKDE